MKILLLLILLTATVFAKIGKISSLLGSCAVARQNETMNGTVGLDLEEKDVLSTKENSKLQVVFNDGTVVTIGKLSTFDIAAYVYDEAKSDKSKADFGFLEGSFKSVTGQIGKIAPDKFNLKTKTATIGIRGTTIVGNQEAVACTQGEIAVSSSGVTQIVPAGMFSKTPPNAPPTPPQPYVVGSIGDADVESTPAEEKKEETPANSPAQSSAESSKQENSSNETPNVQNIVSDIQKIITVVDTEVKVVAEKESVAVVATPSAADAQAAADAINTVTSSTLNDIASATEGLTKQISSKNDYLEYGYWNNGSAPSFSYVSGVVTSSDVVDKMIGNSANNAIYNGGVSSIVTKTDGTKIASNGTARLDFNFATQSFIGTVDVTEDNFKSIVEGTVHKYGFDTTSVTKATNSTANITDGNLNGQFYGTNAQAAGGKFNLNSSDAGSVSGVFGTTKVPLR